MRSIAAIFLLFFVGPSFASEVFVATMRGGHLYRVDAQNAKSTLVGTVVLDGTHAVGLSAMAFHPRTNVLYGITMGINDANRATLLTIDPASGQARVVGRLSRPLSDISFDPNGRLFGWTANTGQLAIVDLNTARVSALGEASDPPIAGAFAIDSRGNAYVAPWSAPGTLQHVDLQDGRVSPGPKVSNLQDLSTVRSMAFSAGNDLLAAHSIRATPPASSLLRIDPATGVAKAVGDIPEDSEAIAVSATQPAARADLMRQIAYVILASILLSALWYWRRTRGVSARSY